MKKYKRRAWLLTYLLSLQIIKPATSLYANTLTLTYDGKQHTYKKPPISLEIDNTNIEMTMPPVQIDGRTLVPTREVFEPMGAMVEWKAAEKKVFVHYEDKLIVLEVNNKEAWIEGQAQELDVPPKIINNKLMLPLRFIGESLGFEVVWDQETSHIKINQETKKPEITLPDVEVSQMVTTVRDVSLINREDGNTQYTIQLENPVEFYSHFTHEGKVVIDISGAKNELPSNIMLPYNPYVEKVRTSQFTQDITRVVFDLEVAAKSRVELSLDKKSIKVILGDNQDGEIVPVEKEPENIELEHFAYLYEPRESIVFKKVPGLSADQIEVTDDYRSRTLTISLEGDYRDLYRDVQLDIGSRGIDKILINTDQNTKFIIRGNKVREYEIIEEDENIRIIFMDPQEKHEKIILLDLGHGGTDGGASANGLSEKKLNLDQGLEVFRMLQNNPDIKVYITREDDTYPTNPDRAKLANDLGADIFVSLHHNSFTTTTPNGTEVLYSTKDPKSKQMAEIIQRNMTSRLGTFSRGAKPRPGIVVLNSTNMPAVLIETAFITNPGDVERLKSPEFKQNAIMVIYDSIVEIFNTLSFR